jgi:hypothetical protein
MKTEKKNPLISLSSGTWVRAESITAIRPLDACENTPARVVVHYDGMTDVIPCKDMQHANHVADILSERVNECA